MICINLHKPFSVNAIKLALVEIKRLYIKGLVSAHLKICFVLHFDLRVNEVFLKTHNK